MKWFRVRQIAFICSLLVSCQALAILPDSLPKEYLLPDTIYEIRATTYNPKTHPKCQRGLSVILSDAEKYRRQIMCMTDARNHYVTLIEFFPKTGLDIEFKNKSIEEQIASINTIGSGVMATMFLLPEEVTKWGESKKSRTMKDWAANQSSAPVRDGDSWVVNGIGHGYAGASTYLAARHNGATHWEAFGFSFFMSTVHWEYGLEATMEPPSIQDIILTPTIGMILGLQLYRLHNHIVDHGGKLFGSEMLGKWGLAASDPVGTIEDALENLGGDRYRIELELGLGSLPEPNIFENRYRAIPQNESIGLLMNMKFGKRR